jgi:hypothetical protein
MAQYFRFTWPYDFRDCYVRNQSTGKYQLSDLFLGHLKDLSCFTFCKDMFLIFPEFKGDIPTFMGAQYDLLLTPSSRHVDYNSNNEDSQEEATQEHVMSVHDAPLICSQEARSYSLGGDLAYYIAQTPWVEPFLS